MRFIKGAEKNNEWQNKLPFVMITVIVIFRTAHSGGIRSSQYNTYTKNACRVYHVESVSKMGLVLSIFFFAYKGLHVLNWPIRV